MARLQALALDGQALLLTLDPVLGDARVQRRVDELVEYAADALRALAERADAAQDHRVEATWW